MPPTFSPLYHLVELSRFCCLGLVETNPLVSLSYPFSFALIFLVFGLMAMRRRLIK